MLVNAALLTLLLRLNAGEDVQRHENEPARALGPSERDPSRADTEIFRRGETEQIAAVEESDNGILHYVLSISRAHHSTRQPDLGDATFAIEGLQFGEGHRAVKLRLDAWPPL
jgi:hypothetical protein